MSTPHDLHDETHVSADTEIFNTVLARHGVQLKRLAIETGVAAGHISRCASGQHNIPAIVLIRLFAITHDADLRDFLLCGVPHVEVHQPAGDDRDAHDIIRDILAMVGRLMPTLADINHLGRSPLPLTDDQLAGTRSLVETLATDLSLLSAALASSPGSDSPARGQGGAPAHTAPTGRVGRRSA